MEAIDKAKFVFLGIVAFCCVYILDWIVHSGQEERVKLASEIEKSHYSTAEEAYWEGQQDALNGDVRIDRDRNCWLKSPWDLNKTTVGFFKMCRD